MSLITTRKETKAQIRKAWIWNMLRSGSTIAEIMRLTGSSRERVNNIRHTSSIPHKIKLMNQMMAKGLSLEEACRILDLRIQRKGVNR